MACRYTYKGKTYSAAEFIRLLSDMAPADAAQYMPGVESVPKAPLVGSTQQWMTVAFKRMVRWAAENGFDRLAWTTGEQQAERYDLSKRVGEIQYNDDDRLIVRDLNGSVIYNKTTPEPELAGVIGKDTADRLLEQESVRDTDGPSVGAKKRVIGGENLKMGGSGMRKFYDEMVPALAKEYGKRFGVKPSYAIIAASTPTERAFKAKQPMAFPDTIRVHALDINEAMRDSALEGQGLFRMDPADRENDGLNSMAPAPATAFDGYTLPTWQLGSYLSSEAGKRVAGYKAAIASGTDKLRTVMQDYFHPIRKVQDAIRASGGTIDESSDVYGREELYYGRTGDQLELLENEHVKPLVAALVRSGVSQEDLELYLYAKFAPKRNARIASINEKFPDGGSGMTNADAAQVLADFDAAGQTEKLESLAKRVRDLNAQRISTLEDGGLLSSEEAQLWREEPDYVPLKGIAVKEDASAEDGVGPTRMKTGSGFSIGGREAHRALGRESRASDLIANTIAQVEQAIIRAEKNRVAQSLLRLAKANPNPALWTVDVVPEKPQLTPGGEVTYRKDNLHQQHDNVVSVKVDGEQHFVTFKDDRLGAAMKNLGTAKTGAFLRAFASVNRFLSLTRTMLAPEFVIANFARDIQTAIVNLNDKSVATTKTNNGDGTVTERSHNLARKTVSPGNLASAMKAMYQRNRGTAAVEEWDILANEFAEDGGMTSFVGQRTVEEQQSKIEGLLADARGGNKAAVKKIVRTAYEWIEDANGAVENATRLSAYKAAREAGMTRDAAARLAKNLTVNFNRKGQLGPVMNSLYLFYNAGMQGSQRFLHAMRSPAVRNIMAATAVAGYALAMYNRAAGGEDDDGEDKWDKIPKWEKARNLIFMHPGGDGYTKIPLPYSYNLPFLAGTQMENAVGGKAEISDAAAGIAEALLAAFNPIGDIDLKGDSAQAMAKMVAPTAVEPALDIAFNRNFFGSPINPERSPYDKVPEPDSQLVFPGTNPGVAALADLLNTATGGDKLRPGMIDVSPGSMVYLFDYATGGTGGFVERVVTSVALAMRGEPVPLRTIPFLRVVQGELSDRRVTDTFYRVRDDVELKIELSKIGPHDNERDTADANMGRKMEGLLKATDHQLAKLRAVRKAAKAADKKDQVKAIEEQMRVLQLRFNTVYFDALPD